MPKPEAFTCKTSCAYIGNKAMTPPSNTANKSNEIEPNTTGWRQIKRMPSCTRSTIEDLACLAKRIAAFTPSGSNKGTRINKLLAKPKHSAHTINVALPPP